MDTQEIIWIVVAVVVVLALVALAAGLMTKKKHDRAEADRVERTERAAELRHEADRQAQVLPDAEIRAKEEQLNAEKLRLEADQAQERAQLAETEHLQQAARHEDHLREADKLDPQGETTLTEPPSESHQGQVGHMGHDDAPRDNPPRDNPQRGGAHRA